MKYAYLLLCIMAITSCEVENVDSIENATSAKELVFEAPSFGQQEHANLLDRNAFLVGELMRLSFSDRTLILNSIDPVTRTVSMSTLLNDSQSPLYIHYRFLAASAIQNYILCGNPDTQLWPPADPIITFENSIPSPAPSADTFIQLLLQHETEIYIPNDWSSKIFTVGHPLMDVTSSIGTEIYIVPLLQNTFRNNCLYYSVASSVDNTKLVNNEFIILSRPTAASISGNNYPYINFDITRLLNKGALNGGGGTGLML